MKHQVVKFKTRQAMHDFASRHPANVITLDNIRNTYLTFNDDLGFIIEEYIVDSSGSTNRRIKGLGSEKTAYGNTEFAHMTLSELVGFTDFDHTKWIDTGPSLMEKRLVQNDLEAYDDDDIDSEVALYLAQPDMSEQPMTVKKAKVPGGVKITTQVHINTTIASPSGAKKMIEFLKQQFEV